AQTAFSQEDFRKNAPKPGPAPRIELGKAEQWTLKNGLKVIVVENHKLPRISFQIFVDAPPVLEGEAAGYVDMAGQLLTKGTTTKTKSQIDEAVDFIGASLSSDANGVNGTCLSKHRVKLLELMSDVLLNPTFPEEEFVKLKKQTLSALAQAKDDPNTIAGNVGATLRNGKKHPYGEVESEATIDKVTSEKCKAYFQTYFKPGISYLVVTGDITAAEVKKLATKYFGDWKQAPVNKETFPHPKKPATTQVDFVDKTGAVQSVVYITYPVEFKPGQEDAIKADVMNTVLGAYFSSRLNANLREDKGYTYGAGSRLVNDPVIGNFRASASVRNEVTDSSITQFLLEINKLKSEEIGDAEMNMVKNVMTGNFARSLEDPATVARFTLNTARFNLPADYYHTYLERLSKVTKQGVLAMAKKYLTPENAH
ncbi:MAG: pitrilysin family protein, partial [Bacteroidota bacterium]